MHIKTFLITLITSVAVIPVSIVLAEVKFPEDLDKANNIIPTANFQFEKVNEANVTKKQALNHEGEITIDGVPAAPSRKTPAQTKPPKQSKELPRVDVTLDPGLDPTSIMVKPLTDGDKSVSRIFKYIDGRYSSGPVTQHSHTSHKNDVGTKIIDSDTEYLFNDHGLYAVRQETARPNSPSWANGQPKEGISTFIGLKEGLLTI